MERTKKNKSKNKVRTWRTPMTDIIEPKKEYMVMTSAGQVPVESDLDFPSFCDDISLMVSTGTIILPNEGQLFICKISRHQHFAYTIMTRRAFDRMKVNQQFMMQGGQGRPQ